jgi:hypothetical protein
MLQNRLSMNRNISLVDGQTDKLASLYSYCNARKDEKTRAANGIQLTLDPVGLYLTNIRVECYVNTITNICEL